MTNWWVSSSQAGNWGCRMKVINALSGSIRRSKVHYNEVQAAPACILWPDRDRQWEAVIPLLQSELPELLILGEYHPEKRTGPAIWLRCAIAGKTDDIELPSRKTADHLPARSQPPRPASGGKLPGIPQAISRAAIIVGRSGRN